MGISAKWAAAFAVATAFALSGCADPQEVSEIKAKVDEIQAAQKDIIAKLDGLGQGQKQILAKAPAAAAAPKAPQEDPNKVYDVPGGQLVREGSGQRAGHDRRVFGFPMSVLLTGSDVDRNRSSKPTRRTSASFTRTIRSPSTKKRCRLRKPPSRRASRESSSRCTTSCSRTIEH